MKQVKLALACLVSSALAMTPSSAKAAATIEFKVTTRTGNLNLRAKSRGPNPGPVIASVKRESRVQIDWEVFAQDLTHEQLSDADRQALLEHPNCQTLDAIW